MRVLTSRRKTAKPAPAEKVNQSFLSQAPGHPGTARGQRTVLQEPDEFGPLPRAGGASVQVCTHRILSAWFTETFETFEAFVTEIISAISAWCTKAFETFETFVTDTRAAISTGTIV